MSSKSIEITEARVSLEAIKALSPEQRFTYYLLGVIYNETLCLRKLITFSLRKHRDARPFRVDPEFSQTFFLFRIACSKVHEAREALKKARVNSVLERDLFARWPEGQRLLNELDRALAKAPWLSRIRHRIGFHYPRFDQWKELTTPTDEWGDDLIFVGDHGGNQYFDGPESVTRAWMFEDAAGASGHERMEQRVSEMVDLIVQLNDFVERALGEFIFTHLGDLTTKPAGRVHVRPTREISIPFWMAGDSPWR